MLTLLFAWTGLSCIDVYRAFSDDGSSGTAYHGSPDDWRPVPGSPGLLVMRPASLLADTNNTADAKRLLTAWEAVSLRVQYTVSVSVAGPWVYIVAGFSPGAGVGAGFPGPDGRPVVCLANECSGIVRTGNSSARLDVTFSIDAPGGAMVMDVSGRRAAIPLRVPPGPGMSVGIASATGNYRNLVICSGRPGKRTESKQGTGPIFTPLASVLACAGVCLATGLSERRRLGRGKRPGNSGAWAAPQAVLEYRSQTMPGPIDSDSDSEDMVLVPYGDLTPPLDEC